MERGTPNVSESLPDDLVGLRPGQRVEVRKRFDGTWARGFEIAEVLDGGYRVRRRTDDSVLPAVFTADEVRSERRHGMWWA